MPTNSCRQSSGHPSLRRRWLSSSDPRRRCRSTVPSPPNPRRTPSCSPVLSSPPGERRTTHDPRPRTVPSSRSTARTTGSSCPSIDRTGTMRYRRDCVTSCTPHCRSRSSTPASGPYPARQRSVVLQRRRSHGIRRPIGSGERPHHAARPKPGEVDPPARPTDRGPHPRFDPWRRHRDGRVRRHTSSLGR